MSLSLKWIRFNLNSQFNPISIEYLLTFLPISQDYIISFLATLHPLSLFVSVNVYVSVSVPPPPLFRFGCLQWRVEQISESQMVLTHWALEQINCAMSNSNNNHTHAHEPCICVSPAATICIFCWMLDGARLFVFQFFGKLISASLSLGRLLNSKLKTEKGKQVSIYAMFVEAFEKCWVNLISGKCEIRWGNF